MISILQIARRLNETAPVLIEIGGLVRWFASIYVVVSMIRSRAGVHEREDLVVLDYGLVTAFSRAT